MHRCHRAVTRIAARPAVSSFGRLGAAAALAAALGCGGGVKYATHDGYSSPEAAPWKNPQTIAFDAQNQAEIEGTLSYPQKKRARWFALDVPDDGSLEIKLSFANIGANPDAEVDLGFELLDSNYQVAVKADPEDQDVGTTKKARSLPEIKRGRYYAHLYTLARTDEAEFTLGFAFTPAPPKPQKEIPNFPAEVAYVPPLPTVSPVDDAPPPAVAKRPRKGPRPPQPNTPDPPPEDPPPTGVKARIAQVSDAGGKTKIIISRGSEDGVAVGWKGHVVDKKGKRVSNGGFTVSRVTANECEATVGLTFDNARAAGRVVLRP